MKPDLCTPQGLERLAAALGFDVPARNYPVALSVRIRAVLREELELGGLPVLELMSWARDDAAGLAAAGVEAGMPLVRSLYDGVSHSPDKLTSDAEVVSLLAQSARLCCLA